LTTRLAALSGNSTFEQVLSLTAAIDNLTTNRFISVTTYADLPNLTTTPLPSGSLILVKQFNIMMMSVGTSWLSVDGRAYVAPVAPPVGDVGGIAYAWGDDTSGQLGQGSPANKSSPITVVGGIPTWSAIAGGINNHTLGLASTGILYAWGRNYGGKLGDNTTTPKSSPITVVGGITTWSKIAAGEGHSAGLTSGGVLYAWGYGSYGKLGDNTTVNKSSPVTVVGGITTWSQITAGKRHMLALTSAGVAYAWGYGTYGRLGDNTSSNRSSPVTVVGGITTWSKISAGGDHSHGLTSAGVAYAWGYNAKGMLGDGTTVNRLSPVTVVGGITTWSQISAGIDPLGSWSTGAPHSLGLTSAGVMYAWGGASYGRLGDNTTVSKSSPVTVVGGITTWSKISAGGTHSMGLTSTGIAYAWGKNEYGQLGDGTTVSKSSPVTVVGGITTWTQISAGRRHSLGLKT
jgi:alpha-tubulin suppressor-like RCC1 family protein